MGLFTSFVFCLCFGGYFIRYINSIQFNQVIRDDGPNSHLKKNGTPTMGGLIMILGILFSLFFWGNWSNHYLILVVIALLLFAAIGFWDDYEKIIKKHPNGLSSRKKYLLQSVVTFVLLFYIFMTMDVKYQVLFLPFYKDMPIYLGSGFVILAYFTIVGTSNAVNLTDGLDGLAILPICMVLAGLGFVAYLSGHVNYAEYLNIFYISGIGELVVFSSIVVGAGLGFLWFNTYPAEIFMGDVGSLSLGSILGVIAVLLRQELLLFIMGGLFVIETLSVILQVGSYKLYKKRIFKMAPLHHHFELKGWSEPKVIVRFWLIALCFVLLGLIILKV